MFKHILVATDGSKGGNRALDTAAELAKQFGAKVTVTHVLLHSRAAQQLSRMAETEQLVKAATRSLPELNNAPGNLPAAMKALSSKVSNSQLVAVVGDLIAERAATRIKKAGVKNVVTSVPQGDYAEEILKAAEAAGADAIVVGRRGLGTLRGLLQGSVSQKITALAPCTVITVV